MAKLTILDAAVYCGTYKKYNEGSLDGGWLYLGRYQNAAAFLEACKKLHADESARSLCIRIPNTCRTSSTLSRAYIRKSSRLYKQ